MTRHLSNHLLLVPRQVSLFPHSHTLSLSPIFFALEQLHQFTPLLQLKDVSRLHDLARVRFTERVHN